MGHKTTINTWAATIIIHEADKNEVSSIISDQYLNNCLICYIEHDLFTNEINNAISVFF